MFSFSAIKVSHMPPRGKIRLIFADAVYPVRCFDPPVLSGEYPFPRGERGAASRYATRSRSGSRDVDLLF